jgi:branched-chain amino acid transport system permease protein
VALPQLIFFGTDVVVFGISFVNFYALYLAISLTLNLEFGYAGIPNFGKVLFIAGGAAFSGSYSGQLAAWILGINTHGNYIVFNPGIINAISTVLIRDPMLAAGLLVFGLIIGAVVGAIFGFIVSYPAIRLREDYLGMLLLGGAQFFQVVMQTYEPLAGGVQYISVPDPYIYWISVGLGYRDLVAGLVVSVFAIAVFVYAERVGRSPLGRLMKGVRDNEDAARALGKDDAAVRRKVLVTASAIAGMAGVLYTFYVASVEYDTWGRVAWTFWPFLIVIIGGAGNNVGAALGTFFFSIVYRGLQLIQIQPAVQQYLFFDPNWLNDLLFAVLLVTILLVRPDGILRERPTPTLSKGILSKLIKKMGLGEDVGTAPVGRSRRIFARFRKMVTRKDKKPDG